ncbi:protease HtpX [Buchnera aphidicola]|uniref:protease HtpX n=1 Tax=Buchnera aphidicola TaxID=9 RepID=UPI0031B7F7FC
MLCIFLFLIINFSVNLILSLILYLFGLQYQNIINIFLLSSFFGCLSSIMSLFLSKWIALNTVQGKIINNTKNPELNWIILFLKDLSHQMKIKIPEIAIYPSEDLNAFATGFSKNNSLIALSTGLLNKMKKNEIKAIIAHEMCHITNGDMLTMTLIQSVLNTFILFFSYIFTKILENFFFKKKKNKNILLFSNSIIYIFISMILEFTLGMLANIVIMWFSRKREYYADAGASKIIGKKNMISALENLKNSIEPNISHNLRTLYIQGKRNIFLNLFLSHPSIDERILALKKNIYFK